MHSGRAGIYEARYFWFNKLNKIKFNENPLGWIIANEQYRAAMGWS